MMMRFPACIPESRASTSRNPVGTPANADSRFWILSSHRLVHELAEGGDLVLLVVAGDLVDPLLGLIGDPLRLLGGRERHLHDVAGRRDQPTEQRRLGDDPGVGARSGRRRHPFDELGDVEVAPHVLEERAPLQLLDGRDRIDGIAPAVDLPERVEDLRVRRGVEIGRPHDLDDVGDGLGREHHRPEDRLLGLEVVRRDPIGPKTPNVLSGSHHEPAPLPRPRPNRPRR
jgi:hypothetical protein